MKKILVYDTEEELIEKIAEDNDITAAEVVEMLIDYVDEMKRANNLI